jgi:hypothetical protein
MVCRLAQLAAAKGGGRAVVKTKPDAITPQDMDQRSWGGHIPPHYPDGLAQGPLDKISLLESCKARLGKKKLPVSGLTEGKQLI